MDHVKPSNMPKRIFLIGATRSGTTLLQSRLSEADNIQSFPETGYFGSLFGTIRQRTYRDGPLTFSERLKVNFRRYVGIAYPRSKYALKSITELASHLDPQRPRTFRSRFLVRSAVQDFLALLDQQAERNQADAWLEKSPVHTYYLAEIEHYVPEARFVHIIRPGKDVVASNIDAARKYEGGDHSFKDDLEMCINRWNNAMRCQQAHLGKPQHYFIYYPALIENPDAAIRSALDYHGLTPRKASTAGGDFKTIFAEDEFWKRGVKSEISKPEDKFSQLFTDEEQKYILQRLVSIDHFTGLRAENVFN